MKAGNILIGVVCLIGWGCNEDQDVADAYGSFEAKEIILSAQTMGELKTFDLDLGDQVKKNQLVAVVDTLELHLNKIQMEVKKESVIKNAANIKAQRSVQEQQLANNMITLQRTQKLFNKKAATQKQLDDIEGMVKLSQRQIAAFDIQEQSVLQELKVIDSQIAVLNKKISDALIVSPVNGTVTNTFVEQGEIVSPGKSLAKIADLNPMELRVYVTGAQLPLLSLNQKVKVVVDAGVETNQQFTGKVIWIADEAEFTPKVIQTKAERVKLVYAVKISVPNEQGVLKIGMPGEVNFINN